MATRGWQHVTPADVTRRELARQRVRVPQARRSKYGARKTTVDGMTFDSAAEARYYTELTVRARAGEILPFIVQPRFDLHVNTERIGTYVADFEYRVVATGARVVVDVKGMDTPMSKWKRKHLKAEYGIDVLLVRA
jgi:uncharacterized protein DUF1064